MKKKQILCPSWLNGKYKTESGEEVEISTSYSIFAYGEFFAQGEEATNIIDEVNLIYNAGDLTPLQAAEKWACTRL